MADSGIKHVDVGAELTKVEWEAEANHELVHGNSFPGAPTERQLFYRDDEHKWYVYNGTSWVETTSQGITDHGGLDGLADDDHPQYTKHSLATAISDFLVASGAGVFIKKTLAEVKTLLDWATDIATHAGLTTGTHGVGASTVASVGNIATHNALPLSHLTHLNNNLFCGYGAETIAGLRSKTKVPALTAISDPLTIISVADWYGASGAYRQADADSSATKIEDDDANFPSSIQFSIVKWASDAAGTANTGIGIVDSVTDSDTLTIEKCSGADFAASYYYWIKHSELVVPVTGLYLATGSVSFMPAEVDMIYQVLIYEFTGTNAPTIVASGAQATPINTYSQPLGSWLIPLTAGQSIFLGAYHTGTEGVPTLFYSAPSHNPLNIFLLKQTE